MNPANHNPRRRHPGADFILIAGFLFLLWAPTVDKIFHVDHSASPAENRLPARRPELRELRPGQVQKFLADGEAYFNDHFGFRNQLIGWFHNWKIGIYRDRSDYKVVTGPNHWLFISEERMVEHYLGMIQFTPQQLRDWQRVLEKRRDWLAARGISYLFVIPPDKQTIYPEELPAWLVSAVPANRQTKLDQFLRYMQAHSTVTILDLRPPLLAAKKTAPTYLQNDTHWNLFGGFVACQVVINTLAKQLPDLPPLRGEDFTWTNAPATGGDLAEMLGAEAPEPNYFAFTPKPSVATPLIRAATNIISAWDPHKQSYLAENPAPLTETAVVFHDSFGLAWQPFLGCTFKRIVFMSENREFNTAVILANRPRVVINEILERYFNTTPPQEWLAHDGLP